MGTVDARPLKTLDRLRSAATFLAFGCAIIALLSSAVAFGLAAGWQLAYKENKFFPIGSNLFEDLASRYLLTGVLFMITAAAMRKKCRSILRTVALFSLFLIIQQMGTQSFSSLAPLPYWAVDYSPAFELLQHVDIVLAALASFLVPTYIFIEFQVRRITRDTELS